MKPANLWIRSLAAIIDSVIVCFLWYWVIEKWGAVADSHSASLSMGEGKVLTGLPALVLFLATAAYWMIPEGFASATLGKLVCGLRVVGLDGQKITFLQSVQRNLLRIKDSFPFYLTGFIAARLSPLRQRLGDLWAKTIVVSASSAVPNQPQIQ